MPHVTYVAMSGLRVREAELAAMGVELPGFRSRAAAIAALPPLGILTLAGMTPPDWSASLHEVAAASDDVVQRILSERPTLVAISALTASILEAYSLADRLRREGVAIALGGLHVTSCPEEASAHADAVVVGEGEPVWPEVLADARRQALEPTYRAQIPFDLADAPVPRFDLLQRGTRPRYTMQATRGCPFACDFCAASRLLGPYRAKPAARVRAELDAIARWDPSLHIELADDNTFALGGPHDALLDELSRSGALWFTEADWRLGENPAVLDRLASSGCVQALIGLESFVFEHRGMGAKKAPLDRMMRAIEAIQRSGVAVIGCFIVGSDGESPESIERLRGFLRDDPCADVQVTLQTPFPGTALRRRLERSGRLRPDKDWSSYTLFDLTFVPDQMSPSDLEGAYADLLRATFDEPSTRRRRAMRRRIWGDRACNPPEPNT